MLDCNDWGWFVDFEETEKVTHKKRDHRLFRLETIYEEYEYYTEEIKQLKEPKEPKEPKELKELKQPKQLKEYKQAIQSKQPAEYIKEQMVRMYHLIVSCIYDMYLCIAVR